MHSEAHNDEDIEVGLPVVFTFGKSKFADNVPSKFWMKNDNVSLVTCGDEHSLGLTESGKLCVFGSNDWGQLGLPKRDETSITKPTTLNVKEEKMTCIAGGRCHTLVATDCGNVYACGCNGEGQLGVGDSKGRSELTAVPFGNSPVKMVSAGSHHSAILLVDGNVLVFGSNAEGQLGLEGVEGSNVPLRLPLSEPVTAVSCGYYHTAIVTEGGKLYTFGENDGKLGHRPPERTASDGPRLVSDIEERIRSVSCGGNHTAAVTESGRLYTFGNGLRGQLGRGNTVLESAVPGEVKALGDRAVKGVSCGESHTAVVTDDGVLYTFGDGRHGKLGHGTENFSNQFVPCSVARFSRFIVQQVACGGCHTIVLAKKRESGLADGIEQEFHDSPVSSQSNLARSRRRVKDNQIYRPLPKILPPLNASPRQPVEGEGPSEAEAPDSFPKTIDAITEEREEDVVSTASELKSPLKQDDEATVSRRSPISASEPESSSDLDDAVTETEVAEDKETVSADKKGDSFLSRIFGSKKKSKAETTGASKSGEKELKVSKGKDGMSQRGTSKACILL